MKRIQLIVLICLWINPQIGNSQISIHPEVGISYLKFVIPESVFYTYLLDEPRNIDPVFGISAHMPIHTDWYIRSRITFCKRAEKIYIERNFAPKFIKFNESNLNIDFSLNHELNKYLEIGLGSTIVRAFAEEKVNFDTIEDKPSTQYYNRNRFLLGLNAGIRICFNRFRLNLGYLRILRESGNYQNTLGENRFDLTVSYHLLGGKKETTR